MPVGVFVACWFSQHLGCQEQLQPPLCVPCCTPIEFMTAGKQKGSTGLQDDAAAAPVDSSRSLRSSCWCGASKRAGASKIRSLAADLGEGRCAWISGLLAANFLTSCPGERSALHILVQHIVLTSYALMSYTPTERFMTPVMLSVASS